MSYTFYLFATKLLNFKGESLQGDNLGGIHPDFSLKFPTSGYSFGINLRFKHLEFLRCVICFPESKIDCFFFQ